MLKASTAHLTQPERVRVLIVDDEPSMAETLAELLGACGYEVSPTTNPQEALGFTADRFYEVALVDLVMPGMNGLELAERLHERSPETQVVIVTGNDDIESVRAGIHVGVFDYLLKGGLNLGSLEAVVRRAAEEAQLRREKARLFREVEEANRLLRALQGLGALEAGPLTTSIVLGRLASSAKEVTGAAVGRALLFSPTHSAEGLVIDEVVGDGAEAVRGTRLGPSEGIASFAAMVGETLVLEHGRDHPRYSHRCDETATPLPGFLCVPVRLGPVCGALILAGSSGPSFGQAAADAASRLATQAAVLLDALFFRDRATNFFTHTSELLVSVLDSIDIFSQGQPRAVAAHADMLSRRLGMPENERRDVHFAALLHDIGKIKIPRHLLTEEGRYHKEARAQMEAHPAFAVEMLKPITLWGEMLPLVHFHHERWDGKGYPSRLSGEEIPVGARIIAVADAFEAMTKGRPYARALTVEEALVQLEEGAGTQFDPRIVGLFVGEYRRLEQEKTR
jgi:response regulator RpfG family c-di-GMP phosphodiesterase